MSKKMVSFLLVIVLICAFSNTGFASENLESSSRDYSILMTYILTYSCDLAISTSGLATSSASMSTTSGADSGKISMYLQRYDNGWSTVAHWTTESTQTYISISRTYYVTSGYSYRVLAYFYAYEGSDVESYSSTSVDYY